MRGVLNLREALPRHAAAGPRLRGGAAGGALAQAAVPLPGAGVSAPGVHRVDRGAAAGARVTGRLRRAAAARPGAELGYVPAPHLFGAVIPTELHPRRVRRLGLALAGLSAFAQPVHRGRQILPAITR